MSLQVWLPLNGDLHNQGCSNYTIGIARGSETYNNSGKIGKCFYSNGVNTLKITNIIPDIYNYSSYSLSAWFYIETNNTSHTGSSIISSGNWNQQLLNLAVSDWSTDHYTKLRISGSNWTRTYNYNFYKNTWYHAVVCDDGTHTYGYVNGILIGNTAASFLPSSIEGSDIYIGGATYSGSMQFFGKINDVRIYDHCLSAAEIKEISQGLVLHYKLDGLNNASILPTQYQQLEYIESAGTSYFDTGYKFDITNDEFKVIFKGNDTSNNGMIFASSSTPYIWLYYYSNSGVRIYADNGSNGQQGIAGITSDLNQHTAEFKNKTYYIDGSNKGTLSNTYGNTRNNMWLFSYGGNGYPFKGRIYYVEIKNNGTYKRIFIPAKRLSDAAIGMYDLITQTFYTSSNTAFTAGAAIGTLTIQDNSGYNHNGTINSSPIISSETMRYGSSIIFDGVDDCIKIPFNDIIKDKNYTVSVWTYKTSIGTKNYQTILGGPSGFELEARSGSSTSPLYRIHNWGGGTTAYEFNKWNLFTFVHTDSNSKLYVNGELKITGTSANIPTGNYYIGAWNSVTGQNYEGLMSDFRIYCTALSADDILQLYHTSAKIDNKQNLHTFELNETNINLLSGIPWCAPFSLHAPFTSPFTNYNSNGEPQFTSNGASAGTGYIEISPTGHTYEYDYTISVNAGNQFYIGFERYDANKTARSNNACVYTFASKPSSNIVKQHYTGTINLATDGTNPCKYIALRILNGWSGTTSGVTGTATIHSFSLRQIGTKQQPKITKTGLCIGEELKEETNTKLHKNGIIETNNLIEL